MPGLAILQRREISAGSLNDEPRDSAIVISAAEAVNRAPPSYNCASMRPIDSSEGSP